MTGPGIWGGVAAGGGSLSFDAVLADRGVLRAPAAPRDEGTGRPSIELELVAVPARSSPPCPSDPAGSGRSTPGTPRVPAPGWSPAATRWAAHHQVVWLPELEHEQITRQPDRVDAFAHLCSAPATADLLSVRVGGGAQAVLGVWSRRAGSSGVMAAVRARRAAMARKARR